MTQIKTVLEKSHWIGVNAPASESDAQICKPDCKTCGGCGYFRYDVPVGHPEFGKLHRCPERPVEERNFARHGLSKSERDLDWGSVITLQGSNASAAISKVRSVIERGYGWVYIWGTYGTAKTLILQIAAAVSLRAGKEAAYVRMAEVLDHLRDGFDDGDYSERLQWWQSLPVLCVDEFERVNETGWVEEKRFVLMDNRYVAATRGESVTIMAGNGDPSKFDGYLWDRIRDGRFEVIRMTGESARPGMDWREA